MRHDIDDDDASAHDDLLDGLCCEQCGEFFEDMEAPGHPRTCERCAARKQQNRKK